MNELQLYWQDYQTDCDLERFFDRISSRYQNQTIPADEYKFLTTFIFDKPLRTFVVIQQFGPLASLFKNPNQANPKTKVPAYINLEPVNKADHTYRLTYNQSGAAVKHPTHGSSERALLLTGKSFITTIAHK